MTLITSLHALASAVDAPQVFSGGRGFSPGESCAISMGFSSLLKNALSSGGRGFNPAVSGRFVSGVLTPEAAVRLFRHSVSP